jgi:hypothetical protein
VVRRDARALLEARRTAISDVAVEVAAWSDSSPPALSPTSQHLVHETTRAVVVVPRGWRPDGPPRHIGCGYDGTAQADAALKAAAELARLNNGELDIVRAFWSSALHGPVGIAVLADLDAHAQAGVGDVVDALGDEVRAHSTALVDDPTHALIAQSRNRATATCSCWAHAAKAGSARPWPAACPAAWPARRRAP